MKLWPFGKKENRASLENPGVSLADPRALQVLFGGAESEAGVTVTRENALSVPAFWQGVNFLSSTIASLPLHVYQDVDGQRQRDNGPIDRMLNVAANESLTSFRWRKKVMMDTLTEGRSYTFVRRNRAGQPRDLFPLDPNAVTLRIQGGEMFYDYTPLSDKSGRSKTTYTADQIIDIPWALESDGYTHINPVVKLRNALGLAIALETYGARFFNSGGIPPVALQGPPMSPQNGMLTPNEARQMENREPKDGGDSLHLQQNMMDLQSIGEPDGSDGEA